MCSRGPLNLTELEVRDGYIYILSDNILNAEVKNVLPVLLDANTKQEPPELFSPAAI